MEPENVIAERDTAADEAENAAQEIIESAAAQRMFRGMLDDLDGLAAEIDETAEVVTGGFYRNWPVGLLEDAREALRGLVCQK